MRAEVTTAALEIRESDRGPRLSGTILQEGRAATAGRAEVFAPGSLTWDASGIAIKTEHRGADVGRAVPSRHPDGVVQISTPATPEIRAAFDAGKKWLSVEFHALSETRTAGGVREIARAFVEAAAMVADPEYQQAVAEVRSSNTRDLELAAWL